MNKALNGLKVSLSFSLQVFATAPFILRAEIVRFYRYA
jgi:hypothetical protein